MNRLLATAVLVAAIVMLAGGACVGSGLSLEAYYQRIDQVFEDADRRFDLRSESCERTARSEESQVAAARCFFDACEC